MMKATIDIDGVPIGYEPVRFGHPKAGEMFVNGRVIVRPVWQPPAWLKTGWIASNDGKSWFWFSKMPEYDRSRWRSDGMVRWIDNMNFTPPPFTDAASSLREIKGN